MIRLNPEPEFHQALRHLETFSHLWVIYVFHKELGKPFRATIDSPRIDIVKGLGAFACRTPHRPNPIGLSVVKLEKIIGLDLHVSGVDILDGSPVLDIKPYLPYADRIEEANSGWADQKIEKYPVQFSPEMTTNPETLTLITEMLEWDPRPTSQRRGMPMNDPASEGKAFAFRVLDVDVHWEIRNQSPHVTKIVSLPSER